MSGVNCTRPCASDSAFASARTSSVLPRPGTPSMSTWPEAASAATTCSMTAFCPTIARPIAPLQLLEQLGRACREIRFVFHASTIGSLRRVDDAPTRATRACARSSSGRAFRSGVRARRRARGVDAGEPRDGFGLRGGRQALVADDAPRRRFVQRAPRRRDERRAAADAHREAARAEDLLRERAARALRSAPRAARSASHRATARAR